MVFSNDSLLLPTRHQDRFLAYVAVTGTSTKGVIHERAAAPIDQESRRDARRPALFYKVIVILDETRVVLGFISSFPW